MNVFDRRYKRHTISCQQAILILLRNGVKYSFCNYSNINKKTKVHFCYRVGHSNFLFLGKINYFMLYHQKSFQLHFGAHLTGILTKENHELLNGLEPFTIWQLIVS